MHDGADHVVVIGRLKHNLYVPLQEARLHEVFGLLAQRFLTARLCSGAVLSHGRALQTGGTLNGGRGSEGGEITQQRFIKMVALASQVQYWLFIVKVWSHATWFSSKRGHNGKVGQQLIKNRVMHFNIREPIELGN